MPPKKKKAPKKGSKENLDGMDILPEDRIKYLESSLTSHEMLLAYRSEATANAVKECETIREQKDSVTEKYEGEKQMSIDVTRSMTRQYKGMQEELLNKVNDRERIIETLRDELETLKAVHKEQIAQKDSVIQEKHADGEKHRVETENMCQHFVSLLVDARRKIVAYAHNDVIAKIP